MNIRCAAILMATDGTTGGGGSDPGGASPAPRPQQTQQPEQPGGPASDGEGAEQESGDTSGCTSFGCLGCGCLAVVGMMLLTFVGGGVALWSVPGTLGADGWDEVFEMAEGAQDAVAAAGAAGGDSGAVDAPRGEAEMAEAASGVDRLFDTLEETTLTERDVRQTAGVLEDWEDSEAARDFYASYRALEEADDDDSALRQLANIRHAVQFVFRLQELGRVYHEEVEPDLGDEYRQLAAIVRISQAGTGGDHEAWDQQVADALLEDHDEYREEYLEARELLRELHERDREVEELSPEEQNRLAAAYGDQLVMITGGINRESLETWRGLSTDERREIVDHLNAEHHLVGRYASIMHWSPDREEHHYPHFWLLGV